MATARLLQDVAQPLEPGVLEALERIEQPEELRAAVTGLVDRALDFLDETISLWGVKGRKPRSYNQTFEGALRDAIRRGFEVGDLAEFGRGELLRLRRRLEARSAVRSVLILDCANAISRVRIIAAAVETVARRACPTPAFARQP